MADSACGVDLTNLSTTGATTIRSPAGPIATDEVPLTQRKGSRTLLEGLGGLLPDPDVSYARRSAGAHDSSATPRRPPGPAVGKALGRAGASKPVLRTLRAGFQSCAHQEIELLQVCLAKSRDLLPSTAGRAPPFDSKVCGCVSLTGPESQDPQ